MHSFELAIWDNKDGRCTKNSQLPQINIAYFSHLQEFEYYWTSTVASNFPDRLTVLSFYNGFAFKATQKSSFLPVILVSTVTTSLLSKESAKVKEKKEPPEPLLSSSKEPIGKPEQSGHQEASSLVDWSQAINISSSGSYNIVCPSEHPHIIMGGATCKHGHVISESRPDSLGAEFPNQWFASCFVPNQGIASKPNYIYGWCL